MQLKEVKRVMRSCVPVKYDGITYERVTACIMRMDPVSGAEMYSLELLDYCGSAVVIVPMAAVEVVGRSKTQ